MARHSTLAVVLTAAAALLGCAQERTYDVSIRNATDQPLIVWLTKEGGPAEPGWARPEQVVAEASAEQQVLPWTQVPPGKAAYAGPVKGKFHPDSRAVLRVYRDAETVNDLLAMGRDSPGRVDVVLRPGKSGYVISELQGRLVARRVDTAP